MKKHLLLIAVFVLGSISASARVDAPAPFTEVETLRVQNANLEGQLVQRAVADWQAKVAKLKADLESTRPGWSWAPESGAWTAKEKK